MKHDAKAFLPSSRTTVRLPEDLHHRAKLAAVWVGIKLQDLVATALERYLVSVEAAMDKAEAKKVAVKKEARKPA